MNRNFLIAVLAATIFGCKTTQITTPVDEPILTTIDLVNVQEDKVQVSLDPGEFKTDTTTFYIPRTIPGTYSISNYGRYSEQFKAYDYKGREMEVEKIDENTWRIVDAEDLDRISYWTNDTFDIPGEGDIYSMAGTNILKGKNFLLNLHGFVGYFQDMKEEEYRLEIKRPSEMVPGTAMTVAQSIPAEGGEVTTDIFRLDRYFQVVDNPIMYATSDTVKFEVENMEVLFDVYSPNNKFSAEELTPSLKRMMDAQKDFLGPIDETDKYAVLLYLSATPGSNDAGNFGALEHHTSTVVVLPETMGEEELKKNLTDIVSHEFFHIVTPLSVHSEEIHYFDYNDPEMSKHLWMYEGVTEYFANLFQVNQELIDDQEFYDRMYEKIKVSRNFDDTVPFTELSENILKDPYKDSYYNVYQKGALIGMALDIRLRELSNGRKGILNLMKELTEKYGKNKPFKDDELISDIVALTYPEIKVFFDEYVRGSTPIPYDEFFEKVGLELRDAQIPVGYFLQDQATPYIMVDPSGKIRLREDIKLNSFHRQLGLKPGDQIQNINGQQYSRENVYELITTSMEWKAGEEIKLTIVRDGETVNLEGKIVQPTISGKRLIEAPGASDEQIELRHAWLQG